MSELPLRFAARVRDLVHGVVSLTESEVAIINHDLFQRLRYVRQNDVGSFVYPSLNTTRFEHSLGCAHVAGKMAAAITAKSSWSRYGQQARLDAQSFQQICRLYALLHDVGHLPLSHLFEDALKDYAYSINPKTGFGTLCKQWFGRAEFTKPHEANGANLAKAILDDAVSDGKVDKLVAKRVMYLMENKKFQRTSDVLWPIKQLVDSEVDADRVDSTARDGLLAGGEYGTYDIERLCSSVSIQPVGEGWRLAFSHKALGSMETLLFDRYRTHTWIHFHHRTMAFKAAARVAIAGLLRNQVILPSDFRPERMPLCDDVWLWSLLRNADVTFTPDEAVAREAILCRKKQGMALLWKNRTEYERHFGKLLAQRANVDLKREYEEWVSKRLGVRTLAARPRFQPLDSEPAALVDESGMRTTPKTLHEGSALVRALPDIWASEPQVFVVFLGRGAPRVQKELDQLRQKWFVNTLEWLDGQDRQPSAA